MQRPPVVPPTLSARRAIGIAVDASEDTRVFGTPPRSFVLHGRGGRWVAFEERDWTTDARLVLASVDDSLHDVAADQRPESCVAWAPAPPMQPACSLRATGA